MGDFPQLGVLFGGPYIRKDYRFGGVCVGVPLFRESTIWVYTRTGQIGGSCVRP